MSRPRRLAVIPARGGSKRIPGKNIRDFCGRPIISYTIAAALTAALFDVVHVSTEDAEIARVATDCGVPPAFLRPDTLADDHTPIMPVLRHVVETLAEAGRSFDQVWMLMACAPLLEAEDLIGAAGLLDASGGTKPVLAVTRFPAPVEWAFERLEDGQLRPLYPGMFEVRSQDLSPRYFDVGMFSAFPVDVVLGSEGAGDDSRFIGYVLPRTRVVDIDNSDDWQFAEILFRTIHRSPASRA